MLEWIAYPFSRGSSLPKNQTGVSCIAGRFFTNWAIRETQGKEPHRNSPLAAFGIWIVQVPWRKSWKANWMWELEQLGSLVQEVSGVPMKWPFIPEERKMLLWVVEQEVLPEAQFLCGKQSFLSVTVESGVRKGLGQLFWRGCFKGCS